MKSLQLRLATGLFLSLICVFIILLWLTSHSIRLLAEDSVADHLEHDAVSILAAITIDTSHNITVNRDQIEPIYLETYSGDYFQVISNKQVILSLSLNEQNFNIIPLAPGTIKKEYLTGPKQQPLLIMIYGYKKQDRNITIAVAEDLTPTLARINTFQYRYTFIALVLLILLIAIQVFILRSGFKRLNLISQEIRSLEKGEITQLNTDVPQEVAAIVQEVNWLLKLLDQRLQRSRNSLGDLAHALKTPLTLLKQLPQEISLQTHPDICKVVELQTTTMQNIMDRVLKQARMAGTGPAFIKFDVSQEIPALIQVMQSIHRDKNLTINFMTPKASTLSIDREDMLELAGNLLDNACKWAHSKINLSININEFIHLIIEDDGPGVPESELASLAKRGIRLDEIVSGHGLGLSIARAITEQYGGRLTLGRSINFGGLLVEAVLCKAEQLQ